MQNVNLVIVYYSMSGTNYQLAKWAEESAKELGANVRLLKVEELAPQAIIDNNEIWKATQEKTKDVKVATSDDLIWSDAMIFSSPVRFGNVASQIKQFMDIQGKAWSEGKLANKAVSAMTSANNCNGGQEMTIQAIYTTMMHWGAIIVPLGYTDVSASATDGNPYGTSVTLDKDGNMIKDVEPSVRHQTKRTLEIAKSIKNSL